MENEGFYIRKARIDDVKAIHGMLMDCSRSGLLLPRSYNELYSHLRDFFVLAPKDGGSIQACCALSITWDDLAELRSLVVSEALRGQGWGRRLVEACLSEAVTLGLFRIFTLTYQQTFFEKLGFQVVGKEVLPQKVWSDCLRCPKFPECDEIAMLLEV
ncbi:MAG: N-acetyltransferase [Desulfovibrio sp.]|nr:N-acetyltransferase [Desulfovibrio sp.]MCA1987437.1 N-acetyltransferase [Desulfovibrio sp.]